jgi:hypothetical protein
MKARALLCGGFLWLLCAFGIGQQVDTAALQARYRQLASEIAEARLTETVRWMAAQGSRVAGYPGAERAADYIEQQFRALGLQEVRREPFEVSVPIDEGAFLQPLMQQGGQPTRPHSALPALAQFGAHLAATAERDYGTAPLCGRRSIGAVSRQRGSRGASS